MSNQQDYSKEYLKTKVMTASPEELHLLLYDGAIRFAEEAKEYLKEKNFEKAHERLLRAQNIMLEMNAGLDRQANPDLCSKLSSLYNFVYYKFVQANLKHSIEDIDDALKILYYQRETWVMYMERLRGDQSSTEHQSSDEDTSQSQPNDSNLSDIIGGTLSVSA